MRMIVALLLALGTAIADAQPGKRQDGGRSASKEDRQRMRDDMRDAYRGRPERPHKTQQMSPEQRDKLRRDIDDANREIRR